MADAAEDYASELVRRFDEFTSWAIANWPEKNYPLMSSDFAESRREVSQILGRKLHEGTSAPASTTAQENAPYLDTNPTPWP
ncbi:hypothetical protein [Janthinobacterium sp. 17J80-10]|uniref:hypothetical protein n=1 Tax=Janthinobacterium sp. 17J80-10 TaxID=2497863 RepID=UPI0010058466|nr:hypothetical protein [Janthinobacterium sp. 17J80-10]QAU34990.1 hypothetical protein EKL02_12815 [Janthinobacterium sp. 17J80-10]